MKTYKYKLLSLFLVLAFSVQAQKFDKKIKESFMVNSDVELVINTAHTDVTIETWNKNTVSIEVVMDVEGVSKKEANKILDQWKFEALGNKNKVKVTSKSANMDFNFDFDFDFTDVDIEISHFEMPEFHFPEIEFLELPEMPELPEIPELPEMEFDYELYKNDSTYLKKYKIKVAKQVKKFKSSGWKKKMDSVRNSKEYKRNLEEYKMASKEIAIEMKELRNSKEFKQAIEESKRVAEEVRKEILENKHLWKEQAEKAKESGKMAREMIQKMRDNGTFDSIKKHEQNTFFFYKDNKNSKVKIKKYLKIKVPKNATFDLNVRHGKLNVPNSNKKMSANISYGDFIGGVIEGEKNDLKFSNTPVIINVLNSGNVTLKNVPNATFGTFTNANLFANSSDVIIEKVGSDVALSQKFGKIDVLEIDPLFKNLNVVLDYARGSFNFSKANYLFRINSKSTTLKLTESLSDVTKKSKEGVEFIEGFFKNRNSKNKVLLTGVYSTIKLN